MGEHQDSHPLEQLLEAPGLADALENDRLRQFLDHVPIAIADFTVTSAPDKGLRGDLVFAKKDAAPG